MSGLPISWQTVSLEQICNIVMGQSPDSSTYNDEGNGLPFFQGKAEFGRFHPIVRKWCTDPKKVAEQGDILLSIRAPVGPSNVASEKCIIGRGLAALRAIEPVHQEYIFHLIRKFEPWLGQQGTGSTFKAVSGEFVRSIEVPLAPINEQKRIADKLDAVLARVDACRDRLDRIPAILKRFRQSVLAAATSGRLTEEWRTEIIERNNWQDVCLSEVILDMRNGLSPKPTVAPPGNRILRISAVRPGLLDLNDHRYLVVAEKDAALYALKQDDLLFTRYNGTLDFVGVCAAVKQDAEGYVYPDKLIRVRVNTNMVLSQFIELTFGCSSVRYQIENFVKSSAGQKGISGADLKRTRFLLPSLTEQTEIIRRVESLFAYADRLDARYHTARAQVEKLTPALLAKAFRGELVPQDPNDEPASVLLERMRAERVVLVKQPKAGRGRKS
jgi:type I restriction enzyme S subunit